MKEMFCSLLCCLFSLFCLLPVWSADLKTTSDAYQKGSEGIRQRYKPQFDGLQQQYQKALETLKARAKAQGDFKTTKAALAEIERFQKAKSLPSSPEESEIPEIKAFQTTYVKLYSKLEADLTADLGVLTVKYQQDLDRLLKELTKAEKMDEAAAVDAELVKAQTAVKGLAEQMAALKGTPAAKNADAVTSGVAIKPALSYGSKESSKEYAMVLIPAGTNSGTDPDFGQYTLSLSEPLYMDACEVSENKWDEVYKWARKNGYRFANEGMGKKRNHPVVNISWFDSVKWCNARSEKEGLKPCYTVGGVVYRSGDTNPEWDSSANGYRLPTIDEWRYAARGGLSGKRFPWGDTVQHSQANYMGGTNAYDICKVKNFHPEYDRGDKPFTSPVGSFAPNEYGLYDMAGNVVERCWTPNGSNRCIQGGGWANNADWLRCGFGWVTYPNAGYSNDGFRTVRNFDNK